MIKSVLSSIPLYYLSLFKALLKVIKLVESLRRQFFWGFKENLKGINWVNWNLVLKDRKKGGLGVGSLLAKNLGLLGNWKWRFLSE